MSYFGAISFGAIVLLALLGAAWIHRSNNSASLADLVTDKTGRMQLSKVGQLAALVVSTWGFVHLTLAYKLTEWYFTAYMFAWAGANLAAKWMDKQKTEAA